MHYSPVFVIPGQKCAPRVHTCPNQVLTDLIHVSPWLQSLVLGWKKVHPLRKLFVLFLAMSDPSKPTATASIMDPNISNQEGFLLFLGFRWEQETSIGPLNIKEKLLD